MRSKFLRAAILALIPLMFFSCQRQVKVKGVSLQVNFSDQTLTDNLMTDIQYKWKTSHDFLKLDRDYKIFVHFWHKNNMLFQDDHFPAIPTSSWEADQEYSYTRRIYIPSFIDEYDPEFKGEESLRLSIGFYSPYDRTGKSALEVSNKKLKVLPAPPDTPEIIYEDGWYNQENNPHSFLKQWRWTAKEARCLIDNPHRDALLVIKGGINPQALKEQKVIFKINNLILDEFIPKTDHFKKSYNIKKEMLGENDEFYLTIATDKTFIPAKVLPNSQDTRELGVQISFIYFR